MSDDLNFVGFFNDRTKPYFSAMAALKRMKTDMQTRGLPKDCDAIFENGFTQMEDAINQHMNFASISSVVEVVNQNKRSAGSTLNADTVSDWLHDLNARTARRLQ